jgi:hypothetical protein
MQSKDYLSQAHLAWKYIDRLHIKGINVNIKKWKI